MIVTVIIFCIGLALLVKGADAFVAGGGGLAIRHRVSPALIGFTIIAFGTSLPELVVSFNAAATGNGAIALGNVLGSNVANIALVLALCTLIKPEMMLATPQSRAGLIRHTGLMLIATVVFAVLALRGVLDALSALVLLAVFAGTLVILWRERKEEEGEAIETHGKRDILFIALGLAAVVIGSQLVLMGALDIAAAFGIPAFVVGMSMVAFGTSLPELATSLIAAVRNQGAISVGNILGSNIFNLLLVLGLSALVTPIAVGSFTDVLIVILFSAGILPLILGSRRTIRAWSLVLLAGYVTYIAWLFAA
ncbi:conjugal transfer protein TraR [Methanoculleus taiwanensis]|uniref:Conjugal transfer protein TraR n=1 Tax=Methanoculleus taiwanensis TaxID=1550565 RepID=A0A498H5K7_9EURY|nr:calcium/sodium antiporter [Methanoculleus taiwanensis]RXE57004.1 conjugal transfer protein TraR [Methanoculleus taiwanensis]